MKTPLVDAATFCAVTQYGPRMCVLRSVALKLEEALRTRAEAGVIDDWIQDGNSFESRPDDFEKRIEEKMEQFLK